MTLTVSVLMAWLLIGLAVGALARLLVPGRQHTGLILTIGIGIVAALLAGITTTAIIGAGHAVITLIVALVAAALLVSALTTRGYGRHRSRRRRLNWRWQAAGRHRQRIIVYQYGLPASRRMKCTTTWSSRSPR